MAAEVPSDPGNRQSVSPQSHTHGFQVSLADHTSPCGCSSGAPPAPALGLLATTHRGTPEPESLAMHNDPWLLLKGLRNKMQKDP